MSILSTGPQQDEFVSCLQDAASLWKTRRIAIDAPYFTLNDLVQLDNGINIQVDTLRQKSPQSWAIIEQNLTGPSYTIDDLFPATALAFTETAPPTGVPSCWN